MVQYFYVDSNGLFETSISGSIECSKRWKIIEFERLKMSFMHLLWRKMKRRCRSSRDECLTAKFVCCIKNKKEIGQNDSYWTCEDGDQILMESQWCCHLVVGEQWTPNALKKHTRRFQPTNDVFSLTESAFFNWKCLSYRQKTPKCALPLLCIEYDMVLRLLSVMGRAALAACGPLPS